MREIITSLDGAVVMSSANGLVGTGFTSRYWLQSRVGFKSPMGMCKATTHSSLSLTSNRTTNYHHTVLDTHSPAHNWNVCP